MLRASRARLAPPSRKRASLESMGLNKAKFFQKLNKAGSTKTWRHVGLEVEGTLEVAPDFDVLDVAATPSVFDPSSFDHNPNIPIPPPAPLAMPSDYSVFHSKLRTLRDPRTYAGPSGALPADDGTDAPSRTRGTSAHAELMRRLNRNEVSIDSIGKADRQLAAETVHDNVFYGRDPFEGLDPMMMGGGGGEGSGLVTTSSSNGALLAPNEGSHKQQALTLANALAPHSPADGAPRGTDAIMAASLNVAHAPTLLSSSSALAPAPTPLAAIPMGKQLKMNVESAITYDDPTPGHIGHLRRTDEQRASSAKVPKHLNNLFHKIMGWNDELAEMQKETALRGGVAAAGASVPFGSEESGPTNAGLTPQLEPTSKMARAEYKKMSEKLRYGALMEEYDKDQFALENKLSLAGLKFERKFTDWAAMKVVDNAAQQDMEEVNRNKASLLLHTDMAFNIPQLNHDCCKGCGSVFQGNDKDTYGYVRPGRIERYIQHHSEKMKRRSEYGDRMAELHEHWAKNGRRVGEEWLDFMTQDEFDAIYRYNPRPMSCDRCAALATKKGALINTSLLAAPDFTEQLKPLREKRCVVVLVCDITDFPGSMVYDLPALISMNNPVIIALNKLDCIQQRRPGYKGVRRDINKQMVTETYIKQWAKEIAAQFRLPIHRIKDVIPVSAHRAWNVDRLVEVIEATSNMNLAKPHQPVLPTYFVGVSNVGKSSLINCVAHKLYVPQPPHPQSKKVFFTKTDSNGKESVHWRWYTPPHAHKSELLVAKSDKSSKKSTDLLTVSNLPGTTIATHGIKMSLSGDDKGQSSTMFFDTPGLHPHWQATSPLSILDVRRSLQYNFRNPQCFVLRQGGTLLFAGVAAIDVVKATVPILFCVYSSRKAGHAIINTDISDAYWAENLGTKVGPPMSLEQVGDLRLTNKKSYLFECYGKHKLRPKADIYICGMGWVSFFTGGQDDIVLRVRTLPGIVHGVREPLRVNDIKARDGWPKLASESRFGDKNIPRINRVVKFTNTEVDLEEAPIKPIARTIIKKAAAGADQPFDDVLEELSALGKL